MFRKKVNENREILLQAFYNLEDKLTKNLTVDDIVIAFTASDDKTNKLSSIYTLARHLAEENERLLVVDANLRDDELAELLSINSDRGFIDVLLGDVHIEDAVIKDKGHENLHLLTSGRVADYEDMYLEVEDIKNLFDDVSDRYDYVFVNLMENIDIAEANMFASLADKLVVFTNQYAIDNNLLEKSIGQLEKANANILGIILADYKYQENELDDLFGGR